MSRHRNTKVYVGNLSSRTTKADLEDEFGYFGRLISVWVAKNPPGFSYIEFDDPRDAEDAIKDLDGRELHGRRLRVEPSHGIPRGREAKVSVSGRRPFDPSDRCYNCGESGHYAYDCDLYNRRRRERRRRSYSRSLSPRYYRRSYSRSRSRTPRRRRYSRSYSRSRSRSRRRSYSRSRSRSYRSRSPSHGRHSRSRSSRRGSRSSDRRSNSRSGSRSHSR